MTDEHLEPLARYLYAAYVAYRCRITLAYAYNQHAKNGNIGPTWYSLARIVSDTVSTLEPQPPPPASGQPI